MKKVFEHIAKHKQLYLIIPAVIGIVCFLFVKIQVITFEDKLYGYTVFRYIQIYIEEHIHLWDFIIVPIIVCLAYALLPVFKKKVISYFLIVIIAAFLIYFAIIYPSISSISEPVSALYLALQIIVLLLAILITISDKIYNRLLQHKTSSKTKKPKTED